MTWLLKQKMGFFYEWFETVKNANDSASFTKPLGGGG